MEIHDININNYQTKTVVSYIGFNNICASQFSMFISVTGFN